MNPSPKPGFGDTFRINRITGCHIWARSRDKEGYGYFRVSGKVIKAHRHYYEVAKGPIPTGLELDHLCENRACVNPEHLEAVTHVENVRRGHRVKLLDMEKATEIRRLASAGMIYREIAGNFGVSESMIAQITTNRAWVASPPSPASLPSKGGAE